MNRLIRISLLGLLAANVASADLVVKEQDTSPHLRTTPTVNSMATTPKIKSQTAVNANNASIIPNTNVDPTDASTKMNAKANAKIKATATGADKPKASTPPKPFNPSEYTLKLGAFKKKYPIVVAPSNEKLGIVYLNDINDNWQLAEEVSTQLIKQLRSYRMLDRIEALVMPGDKANMLGTFLAKQLKEINPKIEFVIIRANDKGGAFKTAEYQSVTSDTKKVLYLREDQFHRIKGKRTLVFDDVLSSGATLKAVSQLLSDSKAHVLAYACAATEGQDIEHFNDRKVFKTFYLPTYVNPNVEPVDAGAKKGV